MSSQLQHSSDSGTDCSHKVLNLYNGQIEAYHKAKAAVMKKNGPELTEGEVVEELATAYIEDNPLELSPICGLVDETAVENGDPVFTREEVEEMDSKKLRRLAADSNTDSMNGRNTRLEWIAYFSCPYPKNDAPEF